ncbi:MAG: DUF1343 domain-containing protein [Flavipsychrobacter sp.]
MMRFWLFIGVFIFSTTCLNLTACSQEIQTGADRFEEYLPLLANKKVALLINQTSEVDGTSLLDTLLSQKINVVKVFVPEHGFRGQAEAGEKVDNTIDSKTKTPIISLYGKSKKPKEQDLKDVDVLIYDLQDVGTRFYTYISSLQYAMEACAKYNVEFIILDRPNPNGHYIDGPVLEEKYRSFVGMQSIPVVYAMTAGEYAKMLVGEKWFDGAEQLKLAVIPCANYDHSKKYELPVSPSPNLRNMAAIYCYPSLCFFEGTVASVGRGTDMPFQQFGHPAYKGKTNYSFMPNIPFKGPQPKLAGERCYGQVIALNEQEANVMIRNSLRLTWLINAYNWYPEKDKFFNSFFEKLVGNSALRKQIMDGVPETDIKASWQKDIDAFKEIRKKYLLYSDFAQ